ncbi:F-box domain [Dillenia turbinata]|uniref:F-box domain n=1 Tax=Dillenia turbinata TaxID=194707 RepID=A0AAN8W3J9_9MAGN
MANSKLTSQGNPKDDEEEEDRISKLPNAILARILSHLPTKLSVSTSILSSKWRYIWTSVADLFFEFGEAVRRDPRFINFIDRVFALHNPNKRIRSLRIYWYTKNDFCEDLAKWSGGYASLLAKRMRSDCFGLCSFRKKPFGLTKLNRNLCTNLFSMA